MRRGFVALWDRRKLLLKRTLINFLREIACYAIIVVILLFIAKKLGWTNNSILESTIGLTIGWILWRLLVMFKNGQK